MHVFLSWEEGFVEWGLRTRTLLNPIAFLLSRFVYMYRYRIYIQLKHCMAYQELLLADTQKNNIHE